MATHMQGVTAKIYKFPAGGRRGAAPVARQRDAGATTRTELPRAAQPVSYACWYHDAAIEDDSSAAKR